jgi:hypothetical protein
MLREVIRPNAPVGEEGLESFERRHDLKLPGSYRVFLMQINGGRPVPPLFPIEGFPNNPEGGIQAFFGLAAAIATEDLDLVLADIKGNVPRGILPIACTDGDDFVVLDLREAGVPAKFWDRRPFWGANIWNERDLYPVAKSFDALLASLH